MKTKFFALLSMLLISCLIAACNSSQSAITANPFDGMQLATLSNNNSNSSPTSISAIPASDKILFSDDFSDPNSGWQTSDDEYGKAGYENGAYIVEAYKNQYTEWGTASKNYANVQIDVDAHVTNTADNEDNAFGVDCRVQSNGDGYSFHISSDGYYSIIKFQDLKAVSLVDWTESSDIPTGDQSVHLTALCQGDHLQFWVNHVSVAEIQDSTFSSGDLSLSAATMSDDKKTVVAYTNYVAANPDSETNITSSKLTINNSTDQDVCAVFIVDPSSQTWGKNNLSQSETIKAGDSKQIDISAPGTYDVEAESCDYYRLLITYKLNLSQDQTLTIQQPDSLAAWDFKKPDPDWKTGTLENGSSSITNDDYLSLAVTQSNSFLSIPAANYTVADAMVRTSAMLVKPSDSQEAIFGVMCRVQPDGSGIFFAIRSDGAASIQKVTNGQLTALLDWQKSSFIQQGINSNVIEGNCSGSSYTFYVNGDFIGKAQDSTYTSGQVGLAVMDANNPIQVDFDFLKVYPPEQQ